MWLCGLRSHQNFDFQTQSGWRDLLCRSRVDCPGMPPSMFPRPASTGDPLKQDKRLGSCRDTTSFAVLGPPYPGRWLGGEGPGCRKPRSVALVADGHRPRHGHAPPPLVCLKQSRQRFLALHLPAGGKSGRHHPIQPRSPGPFRQEWVG